MIDNELSEEWDEETWYDNFLIQKRYYENSKEAYDNCNKHNQELYDDVMYHYFQMKDCAEHLETFGVIVELPE